MTVLPRRFTNYEVDDALHEAALRDLGCVLGNETAVQLYFNNVGFHTAVDALLRAGWWPHSLDVESRRDAEDRAAYAASVLMGTMRPATAVAPLELS